jgi:transcriptional regulator with XRE-family HTH domain
MKNRAESSLQLGKRLKRLRQKRSLPSQAVASAVGVSVSTYREWENGRAISGEPYAALAKVLNSSVHEILGLSDNRIIEISDSLKQIERLVNEIKNKL